MRYLIAPNAFKGTIEAEEAAKIISGEIKEFSEAECILQPVADGGDGTCSLLIDSLVLEKINFPTLNALGRPIEGYFGWDSKSKKAYLDVSTSSGVGSLSSHEKDPFTTSTFGTGLLIKRAIEIGAEEIILGLGGSATVDLGTGILSAVGILFLNQDGREIPLFSPDFLSKINHIQKTANIPRVKFTCLCDVRNPFFGSNGAVPVFGPQKGLKAEQIESFEKVCEAVKELMVHKSKKEWKDLPGFGAAGGIALGLDSFFDTQLKFGAQYFFDQVDMEKKVIQSDWIVTGEGKYDTQSVQGKASFHLLEMARAYRKKIALITSGSEGRDAGFDVVLELPALDFTGTDYKEKARENLHRLIRDALKKGLLD